MSPTLTTFLFEAANFLVLAAVLGWLFFKPVRQALADHRAGLGVVARSHAAVSGGRADARRGRRAATDTAR